MSSGLNSEMESSAKLKTSSGNHAGRPLRLTSRAMDLLITGGHGWNEATCQIRIQFPDVDVVAMTSVLETLRGIVRPGRSDRLLLKSTDADALCRASALRRLQVIRAPKRRRFYAGGAAARPTRPIASRLDRARNRCLAWSAEGGLKGDRCCGWASSKKRQTTLQRSLEARLPEPDAGRALCRPACIISPAAIYGRLDPLSVTEKNYSHPPPHPSSLPRI